MLKVATYLKPSTIHGIGVFAGENIKKGEIIGTFFEPFDVRLGSLRVAGLPRIAQEYLEHFAYVDLYGSYNLNSDNEKYFNHSEYPNIGTDMHSQDDIALRDISVDEELTVNYFSFDLHAKNKLPSRV